MNRRHHLVLSVVPVAGLFAIGAVVLAVRPPAPESSPSSRHTTAEPAAAPASSALPVIEEWQTFTAADGLPSNKALCVRADGDRLWVGTDRGLACYQGGHWRAYGRQDGLPNEHILCLEVSPRTGDLWIGTMGGAVRFSAGRFDGFNQLNSGLTNDFVNDIACDPDRDEVWMETFLGLSRLNLNTGEWTIYTHDNTPMHEPWAYSVSIDRGLVYAGVWGGGVLEYDISKDRWREYRDPDHETELDLLPNDGPVHDVTSGVDYADGVLWQVSYMGAARYDGRRWRTYHAGLCGLSSDFILFVRGRGSTGWLCTDQGLSVTDGVQWLSYRRLNDGRCEVVHTRGGRVVEKTTTPTALAHNYVTGVDFRDDEVWVSTENGVSRGVTGGRSFELLDAGSVTRDDLRPIVHRTGERFRYANTPVELLPYRNRGVHFDSFRQRMPFYGAGRERPEPRNLKSVKIGIIGPLTREDGPILPPNARPVTGSTPVAFGRSMLRGAVLAVEQANRHGGYKGLPFELVRRTDLVQWGQSSNEMAEFTYRDKVWAVLGSIDSNHTHVILRATLKTEVPIVNTADTDPTLTETGIPWVVRVISDDRWNSYVLAEHIYQELKLTDVVVLRDNNRDGRVGVEEFVQSARRLGHPVLMELRFTHGDTDFSDSLKRIREVDAQAVVLWANPVDGANIVKQMRKLGMPQQVFGFDRLSHPSFLEAAGAAAEGMVVTSPWNPELDNAKSADFRQQYRARFGVDPDSYAAHAFDGMNLLIQSIREAGLNRVKIRDRLFAFDTYDGVTGRIVFDTVMNDVSPPWLAKVEKGRFSCSPPGVISVPASE